MIFITTIIFHVVAMYFLGLVYAISLHVLMLSFKKSSCRVDPYTLATILWGAFIWNIISGSNVIFADLLGCLPVIIAQCRVARRGACCDKTVRIYCESRRIVRKARLSVMAIFKPNRESEACS